MSKEEGSYGTQQGKWRVGLLLEASYLTQLRNNPMKLINPVTADISPGPEITTSSSGVVALCKQGVLNTYCYVNEYITPNPVGCVLHAVDQTACRFPAVLAAPLSDEPVDFDDVFKQLNINMRDVHVATGFPQPSEPTIILASQHFMECYGFFTREPVWFRSFNPAPLDEVTLALVGPSAHQALAKADQIVSQLYSKAERDIMIMQQDFKFVFRASLTVDSGFEEIANDKREEIVLSFQVLECSPVLQGKVTKKTIFTFLPLYNIWSHNSQLSRRRRSTREEGRALAESAASASDRLLKEEGADVEGFVIEAISVPSYKLQSQYIVLPKESAIKHGIYHCQNVLIEAAEEPNRRPAAASLSDITVPVFISSEDAKETGKRVHMAIAFLYEDEFELEHYVPPACLGLDYETTALTIAYIHPQLLFFLFPETLSPSVHYYLQIKVGANY